MSNEIEETVDIAKLIDDGPANRLLIPVSILCASVSLLAGSDTTSIGVVAPLIIDRLHLSLAHLGPIFAAGTFGAMLGALTFGPLSDRFGRKRMLIIATLAFGVFTTTTAFADTLRSLLLARFLAGIGLGGSVPCFIALASEYAPQSRRARVTTLIWSAFPLGVILGAALNAYILSHYSWQMIFLVGGVLPLFISVLLVIMLPESIRFLLVRKPNSPQISRIALRILPSLSSGVRFVGREEKTAEIPTQSLFAGGRGIETLLLWVAFLVAFGMTAAMFLWCSILLHNHGFSLPAASLIVGMGGGIASLLGAAGVGRLLEKFGSTRTMALTFLLATLSTAALGFAASSRVSIVIDIIAVITLFAGLGTSGMLALSAIIYPTAMRSTGVGWAMGAGKLGEVLLPLSIGLLMTATGSLGEQVFLVMALVPFLGFLSILAIGWHRSRLRTAESGIPVFEGSSQEAVSKGIRNTA